MNAIAIMARAPVPGNVKTRLIPPLNPDSAAKLYKAFLFDRLESVGTIKDADHFVAYTPSESKQIFKKIIPPNYSLIVQKGTDLGERLDNVSSFLIKKGYEKVVLIDSDSPSLPISFIIDGLGCLDNSDLVLGPCEDGGYYLIGMKERTPEIFFNIPWSSSEVTEITINIAKKIGKKISIIDEWYDIDTIEDLMQLKAELNIDIKKSSRPNYCKNTIKVINEIL